MPSVFHIKPLVTYTRLLGLATCVFTLVGLENANADKVTNVKGDVTVCDSLDSLIVMKEMPKGSALRSDCRVLKKGTWWGVVLIKLIETHNAEQIAIPLTDGSSLKVWAPASELYQMGN